MNTKLFNTIYGLALLIVVPLAALMFFSNRNLANKHSDQVEKITQLESKVGEIESTNRVLRSELEVIAQGQDTAKPKEVPVVTKKEATADLETTDEVDTVPSDTDAVSVSVLNARGVQGIAAEVKETLEEDERFVIDNVDNTSWQVNSSLRVREGFEAEAQDIKDLLSEDYTFDEDAVLTDEDGDYDIIVIIGQN